VTQTEFPDTWLVPWPGTIRPSRLKGYEIEIPIAPFELPEGWVETSIRLDFVELPELGDIEARTFPFPTSPEPGYIDGSIYLRETHNPVDITEVEFGSWQEDEIEATLRMRILFEFEGTGFRDRDAVLTTTLRRSDA
jgi:hypothetical protein